MTPAQSTKKRPYLQHGHHSLNNALKTIGNQDGWVENLGEVGEALKVWKAGLIDSLGGESSVSAMELSVIELACKTHLLLASVDRFLLEQKSLVNKSKRTLFPIVLQRQTLADALASYMKQLGMKRTAKPPTSLSEYLNKTNGQEAAPTHTKDTKLTKEGAPPGGSEEGQTEGTVTP
jgi:hypothetical protein